MTAKIFGMVSLFVFERVEKPRVSHASHDDVQPDVKVWLLLNDQEPVLVGHWFAQGAGRLHIVAYAMLDVEMLSKAACAFYHDQSHDFGNSGFAGEFDPSFAVTSDLRGVVRSVRVTTCKALNEFAPEGNRCLN